MISEANLRWNRKISDRIALGLLILYASALSYLTIREHNGFGTWALDLAKFDQAIWNTAHGRPFHITLIDDLIIQPHFSPALALYAPLYLLYSDIRILFVTQSLFMAGAGYLLYHFVRKEFHRLGLAVFAAYLMNPFLHQVNLIEFRRLTMAVFTTSLAIYYMLKRQHGRMLLALVVTLLSKEDMVFTYIAAGLYVGLKQKAYSWGSLVTASGILYLIFIPFFVIPWLNVNRTYQEAAKNFGYLGSTPKRVLLNFISQPTAIFSYMLQYDRIVALARFFLPSLFLPVLAPKIMAFMIPHIGLLLASSRGRMGRLEAWYPSILIVLLYWATAIGLTRLPRRWRSYTAGALLVIGLAAYILFSPLWPGARFEPEKYRVTEHARKVQEALETLPTEASVAAQDAIVPHVSQRQTVYLFPWISQDEPVDYLALDTSMGTYPISLDEYHMRFYDLLANPTYNLAMQIDSFYLLEHTDGVVPSVQRHDTWDGKMTLAGYSAAIASDNGILQLDKGNKENAIRVELFWQAQKEMSENYSVAFHVLDEDSQLIAQDDGWPVEERYPTSGLSPDELIRDVRQVGWDVPHPPSKTNLRIGLYDSATGESLLLPNREPYIILSTSNGLQRVK